MKITTITSEQQFQEYLKRLENYRLASQRHSLQIGNYDIERTIEIRRLYKVINDWRERKPELVIKPVRKTYLKKQPYGT
jgi:hypothetical protein